MAVMGSGFGPRRLLSLLLLLVLLAIATVALLSHNNKLPAADPASPPPAPPPPSKWHPPPTARHPHQPHATIPNTNYNKPPPPPPPPPTHLKHLTSNAARAPEDLARCLAAAASFAAAELCWTRAKDALADAAAAHLAALPRSELARFDSPEQWSAHSILLPTHDCDMMRLQRMGGRYAERPEEPHGDGPKWLCAELLVPPAPALAVASSAASDAPCTVFSLGSSGDFRFEQSVRSFVGDRCAIYTFDCTGEWTHEATQFRPWCVADRRFTDDKGREYFTLDGIMKEVGVETVELLKIDVEGYEFQVLEAWRTVPRHMLPRQILIEVHFWTREIAAQSEITEGAFFPPNWAHRALAFRRTIESMGYHIAYREMNNYSMACAEYVLVRV
ncbi:methyltransferase domain-containing protein [Zopfochytrium polystomum]|nr:methyltransferase domain-containing protein [Zopfochytrium polystomum]